MFSFLRTLTTWHCPHSHAVATERGRAAIDISCPLGPQQQTCRGGFCCCGPCWDRRTDTVPLHRPCSAYYIRPVPNKGYTNPRVCKNRRCQLDISVADVVHLSRSRSHFHHASAAVSFPTTDRLSWRGQLVSSWVGGRTTRTSPRCASTINHLGGGMHRAPPLQRAGATYDRETRRGDDVMVSSDRFRTAHHSTVLLQSLYTSYFA